METRIQGPTYAGARQLAEEYLRMRDERMAPRSASGGQLEALRLGLANGDGDGSLYRRAQESDRRDVRFAELACLWGALSPLEQQVLEVRARPVGTQPYTRLVRDYDLVEREVTRGQLAENAWAAAPKRVCHACKRLRRGQRLDRDRNGKDEAWTCDLCGNSGLLAVLRFTHAGEGFLRVPTVGEVEDRPRPGPENERALELWKERAHHLAEGWAVVAGQKPIYPTRAEIAEALGLPAHVVREAITSAHGKITDHVAGVRPASATEDSTMPKPGYLYGFKDIVKVISDVWDGAELAESTASRYAQRKEDPLPLASRTKGQQVAAREADVRAWAERNMERLS